MFFQTPPSPPVVGGTGSDSMMAGTGNDTLDGGSAGNDTLVGGSGIDTYIVDHAGVTIIKDASNATPAATAGVNTAVFDDPIGLRIQSFYLAYYGRPADYAGLSYWKDTLHNQLKDVQLDMAKYFGNAQQPEYVALFGASPTDSQFLNTVYQNLFGRGPDPGGAAYWAGILATKEATESIDQAHAEVLIQILDGAAPSDQALINAKIAANTQMAKNTAVYDTAGLYASLTSSSDFAAARAWTQAQQSGITPPNCVAAYESAQIVGHAVGDEVDASVSFTLPANVKNLVLTGSQNLQGTGNTMDNLITANTGTDTLTGGSGSDGFVFANAPNASHVCTITDFVHGTDAVILSRSAYSALALGAVTVVQGSAATGATVLYDATTGTLSYDPDGSGPQTAVAIVVLTGKPALATGDVWAI